MLEAETKPMCNEYLFSLMYLPPRILTDTHLHFKFLKLGLQGTQSSLLQETEALPAEQASAKAPISEPSTPTAYQRSLFRLLTVSLTNTRFSCSWVTAVDATMIQTQRSVHDPEVAGVLAAGPASYPVVTSPTIS